MWYDRWTYDHEPTSHILYCKVGPMFWCYGVWESLPTDQAFHKLLINSDPGWGTMGRNCKPMPKRSNLFMWGWTLALPLWDRPNVVDLPPNSWLVSSRKRSPHQGISIDLYCWRAEYSRAVVARISSACIVIPPLELSISSILHLSYQYFLLTLPTL